MALAGIILNCWPLKASGVALDVVGNRDLEPHISSCQHWRISHVAFEKKKQGTIRLPITLRASPAPFGHREGQHINKK